MRRTASPWRARRNRRALPIDRNAVPPVPPPSGFTPAPMAYSLRRGGADQLLLDWPAGMHSNLIIAPYAWQISTPGATIIAQAISDTLQILVFSTAIPAGDTLTYVAPDVQLSSAGYEEPDRTPHVAPA